MKLERIISMKLVKNFLFDVCVFVALVLIGLWNWDERADADSDAKGTNDH